MDIDSKKSLEKRLESLKSRHEKLCAEISNKFTAEAYRQLNVVGHNIEVCEQRLKGVWQCDGRSSVVFVPTLKDQARW